MAGADAGQFADDGSSWAGTVWRSLVNGRWHAGGPGSYGPGVGLHGGVRLVVRESGLEPGLLKRCQVTAVPQTLTARP